MGRVLARNEDGMDWWVKVDDDGRDLVTRYEKTSLQISARDFLTKHLEGGEPVDVRELCLAPLMTIESRKGSGGSRTRHRTRPGDVVQRQLLLPNYLSHPRSKTGARSGARLMNGSL